MIRTIIMCGGGCSGCSATAASSQQPLLTFSNYPFSSLPVVERSPQFVSRSLTQRCKSLISLSRSPSSLTTTTTTTLGFRWSKRVGDSLRCFSALTPELKTTLDEVVTLYKVVLFMKGTKEFPQCGFSNTIVQILKSLNVPFETFNILENEILRQAVKEYSNWPTFPQLYIDGEFFGGCDITVEAYKSGELQELLEKAMCS